MLTPKLLDSLRVAEREFLRGVLQLHYSMHVSNFELFHKAPQYIPLVPRLVRRHLTLLGHVTRLADQNALLLFANCGSASHIHHVGRLLCIEDPKELRALMLDRDAWRTRVYALYDELLCDEAHRLRDAETQRLHAKGLQHPVGPLPWEVPPCASAWAPPYDEPPPNWVALLSPCCIAFTDGSVNAFGHAGVGLITVTGLGGPVYREAFSVDGTNNAAELRGLLLALQRHRSRALAVVTDSEIAAFAYRQGCRGNEELVSAIRAEIDARLQPLYIVKTTSHPREKQLAPTRFSAYNDMADLFAEAGSFLPECPAPPVRASPPASDSPFAPPLFIWNDTSLSDCHAPDFQPMSRDQRAAAVASFIDLEAQHALVEKLTADSRLYHVPMRLMLDYHRRRICGADLKPRDAVVGGMSLWWHSRQLLSYAEIVALGCIPNGEQLARDDIGPLVLTYNVEPHDGKRQTVTSTVTLDVSFSVTWDYCSASRKGRSFTWNGTITGAKGGPRPVAIVRYVSPKGDLIGNFFFPPLAGVRVLATSLLPDAPPEAVPVPLFDGTVPASEPTKVRLAVGGRTKPVPFPTGARLTIELHTFRKVAETQTWKGVVLPPPAPNVVHVRLDDDRLEVLPIPTERRLVVDQIIFEPVE